MNFVNPLFLIGAAAAAVPILLHLIKREHARKIEFPTLMFLHRISKKTIRYQKLRRWLLLLLRVLAFLFLVFAFMRPYREASRIEAAVGRIPAVHVLVLDNSMSMSYQDRWARAQKAAADIVRRSNSGDKFAVLEFSDRTAIQTQLTVDASDALEQIENGLELSDLPTRYAQALKIAEKVAMDAGAGKRIIHLISDFQKNGWAAEEQELRLGAGVELQFVDVGSDDFSNLAIRDVHVIEADRDTSSGVRIKASVMNFGNQDRGNVQVNLLVDGRMSASKRLDIPGGNPQDVEFQIPGLISGMHSIIIEADDPYLTRDNRFYMTLEARNKTPVMVIESPNSGRLRSPSFFLIRALNVDRLSPYRLIVESPRSLTISGGLLIWNDAPGGSEATQKKLQNFVKSGGGLAVILGNSMTAADFNRSFGSWLPVKMMDTPVAGSRSQSLSLDNYVLMTDVRMDHPIFQPFGKPHSGTFSSARFFGHARISAGSGTEVPARFDNGDPALVLIPFDKGRILLFASSADDSSNDLPLKAVYAPFWQQAMRYLENFQERRRWLEVGDVFAPEKLLVETALRTARGNLDRNEAIAVLDPNKQRLPMMQGANDVLVDKAGFYEVRTVNLNAAVAVNTMPRESDLTHGHPEEMIAGWVSSQTTPPPLKDRLTPEEQDKRRRFWAFLLVAALLFLVAESIVSNARLTVDAPRFKASVTDNRKL